MTLLQGVPVDLDLIVMQLERDYPRWQVWVQERAAYGPVWYARRWAGAGEEPLMACSPELLEQYINDAAAPVRPGEGW